MRKSGSRFPARIDHVHELWTDPVQSHRNLGVEIAGELGADILRDHRHVAVVRMTESEHYLDARNAESFDLRRREITMDELNGRRLAVFPGAVLIRLRAAENAIA